MPGEIKWSSPTLGPTTIPSVLERRNTIRNDNGVVDDADPPAFYTCKTYKGKFFPRGCRGMLEQIQIYCRDAGADKITLRYSPHPCIGPIGEVTVTPLAGWSWVDATIEKMWNYDSLFVWIYKCEAGTDWAYDGERQYDGHESADTGATWADAAIRPFIRAVFTGETPGDVPVSGTLNVIPIPNTSTQMVVSNVILPLEVEKSIALVEGAGYVDLVICSTAVRANSQYTYFLFYVDGVACFIWTPYEMNRLGFDAYTQPLSVVKYLADGECVIMITKRWEFKRTFRVTAQNLETEQYVYANVYPNLIK